MAFYKVDKKKFERMRREAQQFQDDIVCAVGTDFMRNIAEAENRMIFDILKGVESEATADVVEVKHGEWEAVVVYNDTCIATCSSCRQPIVERECNATAFKLENEFCRKCGAKMDGERRDAE